MILLEQVSLAFSNEEPVLLDRIDLTLPAGNVVGLTGPSGGGKTLIGLVAAGVIPDMIGGRLTGLVTREHRDEPYRTPAAIVFQDPAFQLSSLTVADELRYTPRRFGWPDEHIERDFAEITENLDLSDLLGRDPRELSLGEMQRVAVACALMQRPQLIVLDEPTQYMDARQVIRTAACIREWAEEHHAAVLLIEHHREVLEHTADRVFWVERGRIRPYNGQPEALPRMQPPESTGSPLCVLDHVGYRYGNGTEALADVSLRVHAGEVLAILGPNGSGKSTLAKLLCGLYKPTSGSLRRIGRERASKYELARAIGYVMQNPDRQLFAATVEAECLFGPDNFDIPRDVSVPRITRQLASFGIGGYGDRDPFSLSYGEKRRVNITGVLASDPDILILDEPTSALDHENTVILLNLIGQLSAEGKTIILITHDLPFAEAACSRAVVLENGRVERDYPITTLPETADAVRA